MHVVAKQRAIIRINVEVQLAAGRPQFLLYGFEDLVTIMHERVVARPNLLNDFVPRIIAVRLNGDQSPAWAERARNVRRGMTAIDVGANFGYYSLLLAELVGAKGELIAVEPNPHAADFLRHSAGLELVPARRAASPARAGLE